MPNSNGPNRERQRLTIVLLCSGNGSDASSYRPSRDDVRYRHRHDALVRCVASSLYGAAGSGSDSSACELILLYDGDLACMRMALSPSHEGVAPAANSRPPPPFEREVVTSWRNASKEAVRFEESATHHRRENGSENGACSLPEHNPSWRPSSLLSSSLGNISAKLSNQNSLQRESFNTLQSECILDSWKTVESSKLQNTVDTSIAPAQSSTRSNHDRTSVKKLPVHMPSSKRDTLKLLQSTCPVDYLRRHHLNASLDVALRKFNKKKLQAIWEDYAKYCTSNNECQHKRGITNNNDANELALAPCENDDQWDKMERTFRLLLAKAKQGENANDSHSESIIAAYLHESCGSELPCWGWDDTSDSSDESVRHIFLFLGAVRDMTKAENDSLAQACRQLRIPLVACRLGPVPEFTSKIVGVAGYHYYRAVLGNGLVALRRGRQSPGQKSTTKHPPAITRSRRTLHVISIVPMDSRSLTTDPSLRDRTLWCMVRLCVCSLWRSKLASNSSPSSGDEALNNTLTFLFEDGVSMTLNQADFISSLAKKHRAAPSERQILEELCDRRTRCASFSNEDGDIKQTCRDIISESDSFPANDHESFALDFSCFRGKSLDSTRDIINMAYSDSHFQKSGQTGRLHHASNASSLTLFAILHVRSDLNETSDETSTKTMEYIHRSLLQAFSKAAIGVRAQSSLLVNSSQDGEACTITMLQHLDYQGRLFQILHNEYKHHNNLDVSETVEKKTHKDKKKRKKGKKRNRSSN